MKTERIKLELPTFLPHGWQKMVAERMNVTRQTVGRAVKDKNHNYPLVVKHAKELFGEVKEREVVK